METPNPFSTLAEVRASHLHWGWINIYKSGLYHSVGKPGAFDRHGGDVYATFDASQQAIHPQELYVATLPVVWIEPELIHANP